MVAVGNGTPLFGRGFRLSMSWDEPIFLDKESTVYKALALPRLTTWQLIKRFFANLSSLKLYKSISKDLPGSNTEGDGAQTGAVFVCGPGANAPIPFIFKEADYDATTFVDINKLLASVGIDPSAPAAAAAESSAAAGPSVQG